MKKISLWGISVFTLLAACSSSDQETVGRGDTAAEATIGTGGGRLVLGSGAELSVPSGAVREDTELALAEVAMEELAMPTRTYSALEAPIALTPHGTTFERPVEVLLPLSARSRQVPAEELRVLRLEDEADTEWESVADIEVREVAVALRLERFSIYVVAREPGTIVPPDGGTGMNPDAGNGGGTSGEGDGGIDAGVDGGIDAGDIDAAGGDDAGGSLVDAGRDAGNTVVDAGADGGDPPVCDGGECGICDATHFGANCTGTVTCVHGECDVGTCSGPEGDGECTSCMESWEGPNCDECARTHFGSDCQQAVSCVHGSCNSGTCYGARGTGLCDGCDPGWLGENCDACDPSVTFGSDCDLVTCENGTCNLGTCSGSEGNGLCDSCDEGWMGENCDQQCVPYAVEGCYDGAEGTLDVGICKAGYRICHASGKHWSSCFDQVVPLGTDICSNGRDDNCSGEQTDEDCAGGGIGVWVDADNGSDSSGDGSYSAPFATLAHALGSGKKLVLAKSDADGTTYHPSLQLGSGQSDLHIIGVGPTRPTLSGTVEISHGRRCVFENLTLEYPQVGQGEEAPRSTIRGVHNYSGEFRRVGFTAPHGLPAGSSLYSAHHGYDNLFVDVTVEHVVLTPGVESSSTSYTLLNGSDHGTGSQFTRITLGSISATGPVPDTLMLTLLGAWGYCDPSTKGVTAVRNVLATDLDMTGMATTTTHFKAMELGCYLAFDAPAGFLVHNNTMANIRATETTFLRLRLSVEQNTWVSGNIVGPGDVTMSTGVSSDGAAEIHYSDFQGLDAPVAGGATLGTGMLDGDPGFVGGGDYHLGVGSICIDTGDPQVLDEDASRSDMGAYGGPHAFP